MANEHCSDCSNELPLNKLCVKCVKAKCIKAHEIIHDSSCSQKVQSKEVWAEKGYFNDLCAQKANLNSACVGDLTVGNLNYCVKYRAVVTSAADFNYTLGTDINWNVILDDPNGNVSLSPFLYTVPASGYYIVTFYMRHNTLAGPQVIAGIPEGKLTLSQNGSELRSQVTPFLSFSDEQSSALTALVLLDAGKTLHMKYEVFLLDPSSGLVSFPGTVNIEANGTFPAEAGFSVHYLSSLNCIPGETCAVCPKVTNPCEPSEEERGCESCR